MLNIFSYPPNKYTIIYCMHKKKARVSVDNIMIKHLSSMMLIDRCDFLLHDPESIYISFIVHSCSKKYLITST